MRFNPDFPAAKTIEEIVVNNLVGFCGLHFAWHLTTDCCIKARKAHTTLTLKERKSFVCGALSTTLIKSVEN